MQPIVSHRNGYGVVTPVRVRTEGRITHAYATPSGAVLVYRWNGTTGRYYPEHTLTSRQQARVRRLTRYAP